MANAEALLREYERFIHLPWPPATAGPQRVWFAVYPPEEERRLRFRVQQFETATKAAGYGWRAVDVTNSFAQWMAQHPYRSAYFQQPQLMNMALQSFADDLAEEIQGQLEQPAANERTVVALLGLGALSGLTRASALIEQLTPHIRGRLLGFFPGEHSGSSYRLLRAGDGWNYLAVPIVATSGETG